MGCKGDILTTDGSDAICNSTHCHNFTPPKPPSIGNGTGVSIEFKEYPPATIRDPASSGNYNIPKRDADAVMYNSTVTEYDSTLGAPPAICGMATKPDNCSLLFGMDNFDVSVRAFDYVPSQLSFDFQYSDAYFSYLYDTSSEAGHVGIAAYHLEEEDETTTNTTAGDPGDASAVPPVPATPGTSTSASSGGVRCIPCTAFGCTTASTTLSYSGVEDLTGDPDCPHPALFAISSESRKIAFSYDQFSTQLPDGVLGFEISYDGVTYANAWDTVELTGIPYVSSQNPWTVNDAGYTDFDIFDINDGVNAVDFRVKFRVETIVDDTVDPAVVTGTTWRVSELLNNGTGFSVGQVFPIQTSVRLSDNTVVALTMNIRITSVGPIETLGGSNVQGILRTTDTINGHTILRVFHTEVGEFPYHIAYVNGDGGNFTKDAQYTSNRNHTITVKAGYGIPDRAMLVGLYEFLDKSIQYVTGDVNRDAPDVLNSIQKPLAFISLNENGGISDVNISSGVYSFNLSSLDTLNTTTALTSYNAEDNVATSGGTGSGLTVDVDVEKTLIGENSGNTVEIDRIATVLVNNPGSGYSAGDIITISGGSVKLQVNEITHGGFNLDQLDGKPVLGVTSPADNTTGFSNKRTNDGNPEFELSLSPSELSFQVVTTENGVDVEPISKDGGNNRAAKIKASVTGSTVTSIKVIDGGSGYSVDQRPQLVLDNQHEVVTEIVPNDGYRNDLVPEYQDILKSVPREQTVLSQQELQIIDDSYSEVPQEMDNSQKQPPMEIKLDPDRERLHQRSQRKLSKEQTEPLKTTIVPDYDLTYLTNTPIPTSTKNIIIDDRTRSQETVLQNIADITQEQVPEFVEFPESKVQTSVGSFTELPQASAFTKYLLRQYRPDPTEVATITVTLGCTPVNIGTAHFTCVTPLAQANTSTTTSNADGSSTTISSTFTMLAPILGPGCQSWEASGEMTVWHSLSNDARLVVQAAAAFGNPFFDS